MSFWRWRIPPPHPSPHPPPPAPIFLEASSPPLKHQTRRVTGWGRIRNVAIRLYTPAFFCITPAAAPVWGSAEPWFLSDFSIFNNNLRNQSAKSRPAGQMEQQRCEVIACRSGVFVWCHTHNNMLKESESLDCYWVIELYYLFLFFSFQNKTCTLAEM